MSSAPSPSGSRPLQIGKYLVQARIATGGMGAVYKARDREHNRDVALKVLAPDKAAKPSIRERFRLEALYGSQLDHPNIATLYEAGEANGIAYLALEFVEGSDLEGYLTRKERLDIDESRQIIIQATRAMAHLHHKGVIHRDIKPSNFLIRYRNGQPIVKMIDLGLARHRDDGEDAPKPGEGRTLGTVDYIAPEQVLDSEAADVRSDIYSLGCTWYHLLAGRPPFTAGNASERALKHLEDEPPDVRVFNPAVPPAVVQVLRRMLAKDPLERYQTPEVLLADLEEQEDQAISLSHTRLADLAGTTAPAVSWDEHSRPRRRRRKKKKRKGERRPAPAPRAVRRSLPILALLVVLAVLGAWSIYRSSAGHSGADTPAQQPGPPGEPSRRGPRPEAEPAQESGLAPTPGPLTPGL
jgi:serine/threonine-protein kinase